MTLPHLYSMREAADHLGVCVKTLRKGRIGVFEAVIRCGDDVKAEATITAGFFPKDKKPGG